MKTRTLWGMAFSVLMGGMLMAPKAQAAVYKYVSAPQAGEVKYQRPEDLLDKVPFVSRIPRTFIFGDGFKMDLALDHLRIDHMGSHSRSPMAKRNCLIGLSYTTPVAGFFTSRVDVPLMAASELHWSQWTPCSAGDYVAYFSRGAAEQPSYRLVFSAKF